ncbi:unnamed protein product (mitochondrion) [Plasmodiophora brassicae]|uniref:Uncharacterized protein n=1 Tax=Plasmodiophora brassicae TaxID=37360 RepID=A0A0G4ITM5_PLABS|nr:hypothetical protein PBRA_006767 [Plasmodiophora brassicae]SPR00791.1 unnamed protein product [Plasmodiophora brassicae]
MEPRRLRDNLADVRAAGVHFPKPPDDTVLLKFGGEDDEPEQGVVRDTRTYGSIPLKDEREPGENIIARAPLSELSEWFETKKESIYRRSKREPLGRPYIRGTAFPPSITDNKDFRFGKVSVRGTATAGEALFPPPSEGAKWMRKTDKEALADDRRVTGKLQFRYDWARAGIADPEQHRFGSPPLGAVQESAAQSLHDDDALRITTRRLLDNLQQRKMEVGKPHNPPSFVKRLPADHRFGMSAQSTQSWGARECISDLDSIVTSVHDAEIGRPSLADQERAAEIPDIMHGVASVRGEARATARNAICPPKLGDEFTVRRTAIEIRDIWQSSGLDTTGPVFDEAIAQAKADFHDAIPLDEFTALYNEVRKRHDDGSWAVAGQ